MKILCVSNLIDPVIYTSTIRQSFADTAIVLSAGDLPMEYLDFITTNLNRPLLFVPGSRHTDTNSNHKAGQACIDAKVRYEEGLIVAGLGGSTRHNRMENRFTEFQMSLGILKLLPALFYNRIFRGRFLDILLTHASPLGIHDREDTRYSGFKCFLWFMKVFKPRYLVHGNIRIYDASGQRTAIYHKTLVGNAYGYHLIDIT